MIGLTLLLIIFGILMIPSLCVATESPFRADEEGLCSRGNRTTQKHYGERSKGACFDTTTVTQECRRWDNASYEESQCVKRTSGKGSGDYILNLWTFFSCNAVDWCKTTQLISIAFIIPDISSLVLHKSLLLLVGPGGYNNVYMYLPFYYEPSHYNTSQEK